MKQFFTILLAAMIAYGPTVAYSANGDTLTASQVKIQAGGVTYSVQNVNAVLDDLKLVDMEAGRGITKTSAQSMFERLSAALELIHAVAADRSMSEDQKDAVQKELFVHIGSAMSRILRQHGNDAINTTKEIDLVRGFLPKMQLIVKEFLLDAKSIGTFVRSGDLKKAAAQDAALAERLRHDDLRREQIEDQIDNLKRNNQSIPDSLAKEINDLNASKAQDARSYKLVWKPLERVRRVKLGEEVVDKFSEIASRYVPQMVQGSEAQGHYVKFWAEKRLPNWINLRKNRVTAQLSAKYALLGMTVASFLTPDFIGMVTGRAIWTRPVTSIILMTSFGILTFLKGQTVGKTIVKELLELGQIMIGQASYVSKENSAGNLAERARDLLKRVEDLARNGVDSAQAAVGRIRGQTSSAAASTGGAVIRDCRAVFAGG